MAKWTKKSYDEQEMEEILLRPYTYIKPLRIYGFVAYKLPEAYNYWLRIPKNKLEHIKELMAKLNNSIALQDDVQDDALYRRTLPAPNRVFGTALTVNAFVHLQTLVLEDVIKLEHPKAVEIFCKGYLTYLRGLGAHIYWRETQCDVTHEDYNQMAINLTGGMMVMILQLMQLFSDNKTDYEYLARIFALYYQMRDDYVDIKKPESVEEGTRISEFNGIISKSFCDDFTEGKISSPVINALKNTKKSKTHDVILNILKMNTRDDQVKEYLLSLLEESGGIEKTRELMRELETDIFAEIKRLGGNPVFEDLMRDLHSWDS